MPPFGMGLRPATGALGRLRDRAIHALHRPAVGQGRPGRSTSCGPPSAWPRTAASSTRSCGARRVLVLTSADFDFPAELPDNVRYVGAVLDDPAWAEQPWTAPPGDDPLVLVALSSTFQDHAGCLQRIVDGLATLPVRGARDHRSGARPGRHHRPAEHQRRHGGAALGGAPGGGRGRDPRRSRHRGPGPRRRGAGAGAPPRARPGRQRRPPHLPRRRPPAEERGVTEGDRLGRPTAARRAQVPRPAPSASARRSAGTPPAARLVAELEDLPAAAEPQVLAAL